MANGKGPDIPNITGYPSLDTALKYGLTIAGTALAAWTLSWLNAHGYQSKLLTADTLLPIIVGAGAAIAGAVWGIVSKYNMIWAFVENAIQSAKTGIVPDEVQKLASKPQVTKIERVNAEPPTSKQADYNAGRRH
jgi:hypothetical protein